MHSKPKVKLEHGVFGSIEPDDPGSRPVALHLSIRVLAVVRAACLRFEVALDGELGLPHMQEPRAFREAPGQAADLSCLQDLRTLLHRSSGKSRRVELSGGAKPLLRK